MFGARLSLHLNSVLCAAVQRFVCVFVCVNVYEQACKLVEFWTCLPLSNGSWLKVYCDVFRAIVGSMRSMSGYLRT